MNYFAHGCRFLDDPYLLAGTAVPDWLNVVDRRVRVRAKSAVRLVNADESRIARIARGIVQHHRDDDWFHRTRAFAELSWDFTVQIRDRLPPDDGLRPSFLGHILVEVLLDAALIAEHPARLDAYYRALEGIDSTLVQNTVNDLAVRETDRLAWFISRFSDERFLYDYADDAKLLFRLNQVMRRVKLPELPAEFREILSAQRRTVQARASELVTAPPHDGAP